MKMNNTKQVVKRYKKQKRSIKLKTFLEPIGFILLAIIVTGTIYLTMALALGLELAILGQ